MKKIIFALALLVLFSGCIGYFESAEKTSTFEIGKEKISTEIYYEGGLSEKGKAVEDCTKELKELFPSAEAGLEANINNPDEKERELVKAKLLFLREIKASVKCTLEKEGLLGKLTIRFENSRETVKKLSGLAPQEGFVLTDINKEYSFLLIKKETKDYFSEKITKENLKIKIDGETIEVVPDSFSIKDSFIQFQDTKNFDVNFIKMEFREEKPVEFPFVLVAAGFIVLIALSVIFVIWRQRKPEEIFEKSEEEIKNKMKKELVNGLGTTEIQILSVERVPDGFETEVIIKTRKYNISFNSKGELMNYIRI
ncbi:MAG: hypothetical protein ABH986_01225 [archaeon]